MTRWPAAPIAAALLASGCMVGPDYVPPDPPEPDAWHADLIDGLEAGPIEGAAWWMSFGDEQLDELVALAGQRNLDLRIAASRIDEARARYGIAASDLFPQISALGFVGWNELPEGDNRVSDLVPHNRYNAALDMSWELDLWGRVRRQMEAAQAEVAASLEDWRDLLIMIRAEVANSYIAVRAHQLEAAILRDSARIHRDTLALTKQKYRAGTVTEIDLARAQASLDEVESRIPAVQTRIARGINRISVLIGEPPGPLRERLDEPLALPAPPATIAVGIPADVVRRRPDIRAAERRLAARTAAIGVAEAALYPQLSINGQIGFEALSFSEWFDASSFSGSIGPSLTWPVFSGGAILSNIRVADRQTEQALYAYEKTVLQAFEEVENALLAYTDALATTRLLERTVDERERVVAYTTERYDAGIDTLETLLYEQNLLLSAQRNLAASMGEVATNTVGIYKALGGAWDPPPPPPPLEPSPADETLSSARQQAATP